MRRTLIPNRCPACGVLLLAGAKSDWIRAMAERKKCWQCKICGEIVVVAAIREFARYIKNNPVVE